MAAAGPAAAGGSWLGPSWERVEAGQTLSMTAQVSRGQQGWIEDGPFRVYLSGGESLTTQGGTDPGSSNVLLGDLVISLGQSHADVSFEFTLPGDLPSGEYRLEVCNDPCITGLGDLIGGVLYVGQDPAPGLQVAAEIAAPIEASIVGAVALTETEDAVSKAAGPVYQALAPHRSHPTGLSAAWMATSASLAALALAILFVSLRKPDAG